MTTAVAAAFSRAERRNQHVARVIDGTVPFSRKDIKVARSLQVVEIVPKSIAHQVYLFIQQHPGATVDAIIEGLKDLSNSQIRVSLRDLFKQGVLARTATGTRNRLNREEYYYRPALDKEYVPGPTTRKVAPNDKKAMKSLSRKAAPEKKEIPPVEFQFVQGMVALDPNHPDFKTNVQMLGVSTDVVVESVAASAGPVKPMTTMCFEVGSQTLMTTPKEAYQLYLELHSMFGPKE